MEKIKEEDVEQIRGIIRRGHHDAREIYRANAINLRHKGYTYVEIGDALEITPRTAINIITTYVEHGLDRALKDSDRSGRPREFDDCDRSRIVAMVCCDPPEAFDRWTLELIQEHAQKEGLVDEISKEAIRIILQEHDFKPWQEKMWCIPALDDEFIQKMEDVLDVYSSPLTEDEVLLCLDEKTVPLFVDEYPPQAAEPGRPRRVDYKYDRNGAANVFFTVEPRNGVYTTKVTENRKGPAFCQYLKELSKKYEDKKRVILVMDNLNIHSEKTLIKHLGEDEGKRLWNCFEVHYSPKHGSWLNQAEIAIGMYSRQCLGKSRIGDIQWLRKKTKSWTQITNRKAPKINWKFNKKNAREKFSNYM